MGKGDIRNTRYAERQRTFSGLRYGAITPTDIDCSVDFSGKLFIFTEGKIKGSELPFGQRLHLENLVRAIRKGSTLEELQRAYAVVIDYEKGDDIVAYAECRVVEYFWEDFNWHMPMKDKILREFFDLCVSSLRGE